MGNPYFKFNGKTVRVGSGGGRLISPFEQIPEDTLRFEFLDGYDPTNPPEGSLYAVRQTAKGTWSHVYGNVYDWTCHDPKWYVVGYDELQRGPYIYSAFASTPVSNPGSYYADTDGNPLANKKFRIIGGNTSNITHMPKLFYKVGNNCTEVGWFDTHNVVNASRMFMWQSSNGMHVPTLPDFDFSGITNDEITESSVDRTSSVGLNQWCYSNTTIAGVPSITFPSNRAISTKSMFYGCKSLASANIVGLNSSNAEEMFYNCIILRNVPLFGTANITSMKGTFSGCFKVESGALALYQQASSQATPPSNHQNTFKYCGRDTVTGAAELAQIPRDWGGTYTPPS
jgi:hypothetical protein